jgi:hypothetical protein
MRRPCDEILDTDGDEQWRQQQNVDLAAALRAAGHEDVTCTRSEVAHT